jgi:hypothetical protein
MKRSPHRALLLLTVLAVLAGSRGPKEETNAVEPSETAAPTVSPTSRVPVGGASEAASTPPAATYAPEITSEEVPVAPELTISIGQVRQDRGHVSASAKVNIDGTCVFQFDPSDGSRPVVREDSAVGGSCSVSIPEVEFALLGSWTLRATVYHAGGKAEDGTDVTIH